MKKSEKWMIFAVLGALGIIGLCLVCVVGAIFVPVRWWSHGGAAGAAKDYLSTNPTVVAQLGAIKEFGLFPTGSQSIVNGEGTAHLAFSLTGEKGRGTAEVDLSKKKGGPWKVVGAKLTVGGQTLPLLEGPDAPRAPQTGDPQGEGPPASDSGPLDT